MAVRRRKEVEDPNNTWNMQLMAAVLKKDTKTADELLLKGAQIDHYAPIDISTTFATSGVSDVKSLLAVPQLRNNQTGGAGANPTGGTNAASGGQSPAAAPLTNTIGTAAAATTMKPPTAGGANNAAAMAAAAAAATVDPNAPTDTSHLHPSGVDPTSKHVAMITPFIAALLNEDYETATWISAHGGNPNGQFNNNTNGTVLHYCVRTDNSALLDAILSRRAAIDAALDINFKETSSRLTAVQMALHLRKPEMARVLIRHGCTNPFFDLIDGRYNSTQYACLVGDVATLETNLSAGDNIRQKDLNGQTLMHLALLQPSIMEVLLERGGATGGSSAGGGMVGGGGVTSSPTSAGNVGIAGSNSPTTSPLRATANAEAMKEMNLHGTSTGNTNNTPPLTLNNAYNDDGETPLIFVIKHWSSSIGVVNSAGVVTPNVTAQQSGIAVANTTAATLTSAMGSGANSISSSHIQNGLLTTMPQTPLTNMTQIVAATTGYNATIAAALSMATGGVPLSCLITQATAGASGAGGGAAGGGSGDGGPSGGGAADSGGQSPSQTSKKDKSGNNTNAAINYGYGLMKTAIELVDWLVAKGADPSTTCDSSYLGMTPLMHALVAYCPDIIRRLVVDLKVDINARDQSGATALHYCIPARMRGALELLCLVENIDLNACDLRGETPLHRAAIRGEAWAILHLLAQPFCDVNAVDCRGYTVMHAAIEHNQLVSLQALIPRCAKDVGVPPPLEKGKKPPAPKKGQPPLEPPVPMRFNIEFEEAENGWTPLQLAIAKQRYVMAAILVTEGLSRVQRPFAGGYLLHEVVRQQSFLMVQLLISNGADVHGRDDKDQTALHVACDTPTADLAIVDALLNANATIDDQDNYKLNTPLHIAAAHENVSLVRLLLERKAKPSISNKDLALPIHIACDGADADIVNDVISGSKNLVTVKGMQGHVGAVAAIDGGLDSAVTLEELRSGCAAKRDFTNRNAIIDALIAHGTPLRTNDTNGRLPLHCAAATGNVAAVAAILEASESSKEAALMACDVKGWTPLHTAVALGGDAECVALLLSHYETLPAGCFGIKPKAGPSVQVPKKVAAGPTAPAAIHHYQQNQPTASASTSLPLNGGGATARAASPNLLTVDTDPVLAILRRQDDNNRHPLLLAATMGRVEIGRYLVKYQKLRVDALKAGSVVVGGGYIAASN